MALTFRKFTHTFILHATIADISRHPLLEYIAIIQAYALTVIIERVVMHDRTSRSNILISD